MMSRGSGQPTRAGALRAVRAAAGRCFLALILAAGLCLTPYSVAFHDGGVVVQQDRAYAVAPIIAGAGVVLKEIAIQAGLSIGAVAVTDAVLCTAGIGKSPYDSTVSYQTAGELPPAAPNRPNWPKWENMTDAQKEAWGNSESEYRSAYTAVCTSKVLGIDDYYDQLRTWQANGGDEASKPTPSPAVKEKLAKFGETGKKLAKGAAVPLASIVGMVAVDGLLDLFFGSGSQSLGYSTNFKINTPSGNVLPFANIPYGEVSGYTSTNAACIGRTDPSYTTWRTTNNPSLPLTIRNDSYIYIPGSSGEVIYQPRYKGITNWRTNTSEYIGDTGWKLNPSYPGGYILPGGGTFKDGQILDSSAVIAFNYAPVPDTPTDIPSSVSNSDNLSQALNENANKVGDNGYLPSVVMPSDGIGQDVPYPEMIVHVSPIPTPSPNPDPTPDPGPQPEETPKQDPTDFEQELRDKTDDLLNTTVSGMFPFCLIYDAQRMMKIVENRVEGSSDYDGTLVEIPMSEFNLGINNWVIDFTPIKQFANYIRPFTPWVLIAGLLAASYSFFLRRGGE